jgi:hypothetical protein
MLTDGPHGVAYISARHNVFLITCAAPLESQYTITPEVTILHSQPRSGNLTGVPGKA